MTTHVQTLEQLRVDFDMRSKGSLSMPLAGALVWAVVAVLGYILPSRAGILALVISTGAIFPIALGIAKLRGEQLVDNPNPLAKLIGACVVMVNLLWGLHVPLLINAPEFVPLSLGIALGLHWMVYSWIIGHPLGYRHAILRTIGLVAAWWAFPEHRVTACASIIVLAYAVTLIEMRARSPINNALATSPIGP